MSDRCPIFLTPERVPGGCDGCGKPLPTLKNGRRWCSAQCTDGYWRNHGWTQASWLALHRATVYSHNDRGDLVQLWRPCDNCGRDTFEGEHRPTYYPKENAKPLELAAEVNHVEPRVGKGYGEGCWNHQTNLQVLCHGCHVEETKRQRLERVGPPKEALRKTARRLAEKQDLVLWDAA